MKDNWETLQELKYGACTAVSMVLGGSGGRWGVGGGARGLSSTQGGAQLQAEQSGGWGEHGGLSLCQNPQQIRYTKRAAMYFNFRRKLAIWHTLVTPASQACVQPAGWPWDPTQSTSQTKKELPQTGVCFIKMIFFFSLFFLFWWFWDRVSLCSSLWLSWNLFCRWGYSWTRRPAWLCFPSGGIKNMRHHAVTTHKADFQCKHARLN